MDPKLLERYTSEGGAAAYRRKYERSWIRRLSHRREMAIVRRALQRAEASGSLLDCPCGAGRLIPTLLRFADRVTGVDVSPTMVAEARDALASECEAGRVELAVGSALALPFPDDAFHTVVCHRLIHHMPDPAERAAVFAELARVAAHRVVLSFNDDSTRKGRRQRARGVHRRRSALLPEALFAELAPHGLRPLGAPLRLNGISSLVAVVPLAVEAVACEGS